MGLRKTLRQLDPPIKQFSKIIFCFSEFTALRHKNKKFVLCQACRRHNQLHDHPLTALITRSICVALHPITGRRRDVMLGAVRVALNANALIEG